ncbi:MAG: DUF5011 domain-containing protein [Lachnospiraceae bacterium]|nr:DUF5011 domain-containing protein [Lachnospiraceae bacterium]
MPSTKKKLNLRGRLVIGTAVAVFILLILAAVSFLGSGSVELTIKGDKEILISYGVEHYTEPGAEAVYHGKLFTANVPLAVTTEGQPGYYAVPGTYQVIYSASYHGKSAVQKTRTVIIRDLTPPDIVLLENPDQLTEVGEIYQEEGFFAYDRFDGDLTGQVIRRDGGDGFVYYSVTDSSGNKAEVRREIRYHDTLAPVLTLNGASDIVLRVGDVFEDPGAVALDNADGNLTDSIRIDGRADTEKEGTYVLTYQVSDRAGNTAEVKRTVTVKAAAAPDITGDGGVIYLTFDDGPGPYTEDLLTLLARYNVKATFFVTNQKPNYQYCLSLEAAAGHSIGIHSASHSYDIYASEEAYWNDINTMRDIIIAQTGKTPDILRFIGGSSTTKANDNPGIISRLAAQAEAKGYAYFDWNVSTGDGNFSISTQDAYNYAITGISQHKNSVVLMHDLNKNSMAAVEDIIKWGLANGYTFLPLTHDSPVCHHRINN